MAVWVPGQSPFGIALREPNLLVKNKLPIGQVTINWKHPLAKDLAFFLVPDGAGGMIDIVGKGISEELSTNKGSSAINNAGRSSETNGSSDKVRNEINDNRFDVADGGDVTIAVGGSWTDSLSNDWIFGGFNDSSNNSILSFVKAGAQIRTFIRNDSNQKSYDDTSVGLTLNDGKSHNCLVALTQEGSPYTADLIVDGTYVKSQTSLVGINTQITITHTAFGVLDRTSDSSWAKGKWNYACGWKRRLTQVEGKRFTANFNQILKSANQSPYRVSVGSSATETHNNLLLLGAG